MFLKTGGDHYRSHLQFVCQRVNITMVCCTTCGEDFSRTDSLARHKRRKYPCSPKTSTKENYIANSEKAKSASILPRDRTDIPTFDGAKFIEGKPKTEEMIKIMEMLNIPQENHAKLLKEEKNDLKEAPTKKMKIIPLTSIEKGEESSHALNLSKPNEPSVVKAPHLNAKEKKLVNEFTRLFKERKEIKNKGKLCKLLDTMRAKNLINELDYVKVYKVIFCK